MQVTNISNHHHLGSEVGPPIETVTILDLLEEAPSKTSTYIIKTDIEGFDCKVNTNL